MNRPALPLFTHLVALASLLAVTTAHAAVFTVGPPGNTASCSHATIQAAIDAAAASHGLDIIRLATGVYPAQGLVINDANDLAIEGGFLECATLVHVDFSTLDGLGANPSGPVIRQIGAGHLALADLHVLNGNASDANATTTLGGGVSSSGTGGLTVYRSLVYNNRARYGGGLYVNSSTLTAKEVKLIGVGIGNNTATESGGGMYAAHVDLFITGEDVSYFAGNHADSAFINNGGGALCAIDSNVTIDAPMPTNFPFMDGNWTASVGGAIYFGSLSAGQRSLYIDHWRGGDPPTIANNFATKAGGAIYMRATASGAENYVRARLTDVIVSDNRAEYGSAFYLYASNDTHYNLVELSMLARLPSCATHLRCNRVEGNVSTEATVEMEQAGSQGRTKFEMERGHLVGNIATYGSGLIFGRGSVRIDNSVLTNNDAGGTALISSGGGEIVIQNSTIAENIRVTPGLLRTFSPDDELVLHNSIVYQPGVPVLQSGEGPAVSLRNLLLGSGHGLGNLYPRNLHDTLDPHFVNPGQNDFRLQPGSQARNRWEPGGGVNVPEVDLLGATRPAPPVGPTPYDFGAYEYGAVVDEVFANGFESY